MKWVTRPDPFGLDAIWPVKYKLFLSPNKPFKKNLMQRNKDQNRIIVKSKSKHSYHIMFAVRPDQLTNRSNPNFWDPTDLNQLATDDRNISTCKACREDQPYQNSPQSKQFWVFDVIKILNVICLVEFKEFWKKRLPKFRYYGNGLQSMGFRRNDQIHIVSENVHFAPLSVIHSAAKPVQ